MSSNPQPKSDLRQKIGLLRQWLNEDRIKDAKLFVTNEMLEHWLLPEAANPLPESELEQILDRLYANAHWLNGPVPYKAGELLTVSEARRQIQALLAQEYARGKQDALNKVREQANGSYEVRTPKEPQYMVWEIAEWQLKDIEKLKEQG